MLWDRDGDKCGICGEPITLAEATIDHILASTRGGTDDLVNLQLAHRPCNTGKSNRIQEGLRPRPQPNQSKMIAIAFRPSAHEEAVLKAYAQQEGRSVCSIVREMIRSLEPQIVTPS